MIEVLYFEGCPHFEATLSLADEVLSQLGVSAESEPHAPPLR